MKVLLTGASGFIGRAVLARLRSNGHDVTCLMRASGTSVDCNQVVHATLGSDTFTETVLANSEPCETIVHAAACISDDNLHPDLIRVNCMGTQQVLSVAANWKTRRIVFLSSLSVVGQPLLHPITEAHGTCPRTTYQATKLFGERLLAAAAGSLCATAALRISAPVGPNMPYNRILSVFVREALLNRHLRLHGQGTRQQNYVDVRDVADAVAACVEQDVAGVFNVGGATTISNRELAETCVRLLDSGSVIQFSDIPDPADEEVWDVSIDAANKAFGYVPQHDIESSIRAVMRQYTSDHS